MCLGFPVVTRTTPQPEPARAPPFVQGVRDYAIFMLDREGRVMSWNAGAEEIKGYTAAEIIGESFTRFYTPEDVADGKPRRVLAEALAHGHVEDHGWRLRKDGTRFWADVVVTAIFDDTGEHLGFAKVTRDLTERRRAEVALQESEERLRLLVESVKDYAIYMLDPEGRVASWNAGAERITGYLAAEVIGRHFSMFYPTEDVAQCKPARELEIAVAEDRYEEEGWRIRKGGQRFWGSIVLTSVYDGRGVLRGFAKVVRDLTDRRRAEELLRHSEQRNRLLLESVKDYAIFMLDADGRVATWNAGAQAMKGYRGDEVLGRHVSIFYTPEDAQRGLPAQLLRAAAATGRSDDEGWRVRRDGSRFWADVVLSPVKDVAGRLIGFAKVTRDLTIQREAAERLRHSEERLRLMVESVRDYAIFMLDAAGRVATWNSGAERLNGYRAAEVIGRPVSILYEPSDVARGLAAHEIEVATRDGRFEDEGWRVRKDGSRYWASVILTAVQDGGGRLVGFTKVTRDLTESKRAAEALAARAREQEALADLSLTALRVRGDQAAMDQAVAIVRGTLGLDAAHVVETLAEGGARVRASSGGWLDAGAAVDASPGSQVRATIEAPWPLVVDDAAREERFTIPRELLAAGVTSGLSVVVRGFERRPPGVLWAWSRAPRAFRPDEVHHLQAIANVVATAVARAVTEEQLWATEREAARERESTLQAQAALRERDDFISVAAHELRTPLAALQLKLESVQRILRREPAETLAARCEDRVESALRQAARLTELVDRLLEVSRVVSGRLSLQRDACELVALAREVLEDHQEHAALTGTELRFRGATPITGRWDRMRVRQILSNLVSNAMKYGPGQPVDVIVEGEGDLARVTVRDRGIGIAPEDLGRIFGRFERAAPIEHYGGLGLGLYVSRHLAEAHGGRIDVESRPGEGATFVLRLPTAMA
jgi:PAS domain S-box-containing protein